MTARTTTTGGWTRGQVAVLIAADALAAMGWSLAVGALAPRWPADRLGEDRGPLRLTRWDRLEDYRRAGVTRLAALLPEGGAWFGGTSKSALPGRDAASLRAYLVEVRRGEWVHLLSIGAAVPLAGVVALQVAAAHRRTASRAAGPASAVPPRAAVPVAIGTAVAAAVAAGNLPFLLILRYNRVRITRILARAADRRTGGRDPQARA